MKDQKNELQKNNQELAKELLSKYKELVKKKEVIQEYYSEKRKPHEKEINDLKEAEKLALGDLPLLIEGIRNDLSEMEKGKFDGIGEIYFKSSSEILITNPTLVFDRIVKEGWFDLLKIDETKLKKEYLKQGIEFEGLEEIPKKILNVKLESDDK